MFKLDFELQNEKQYFLQLENVKDVGIAVVKINGVDKGILWTKPFRVEVSKELQQGENTLEIEIGKFFIDVDSFGTFGFVGTGYH